jgi:hypothetical protein
MRARARRCWRVRAHARACAGHRAALLLAALSQILGAGVGGMPYALKEAGFWSG